MYEIQMTDYVTRTEFKSSMDKIDQRFAKVDQKFDELTEIMIGQFDRMYEYANENFGKVYTRLDGIDRRLDGIDGRLHGMDSKLDLIVNHLGIKA